MIAFLDIIENAYTELIDELESKAEILEYFTRHVYGLPSADDKKIANVYVALIQAALLSDNGIEITELAQMTGVSRSTAEKRLKLVDEAFLITNIIGKTKYYSADINAIDSLFSKP